MLPVGERKAADARRLVSDYFIPREFVDCYAHEVKSRRVKNPRVKLCRSGDVTDTEDEDTDEEWVPEEGGDPTDGSVNVELTDPATSTPIAVSPVADPPVADPSTAESSNNNPSPEDAIQKALANRIREACVVNWKAAASEEKKRMWSIFDETGVFAAACRHGFLLWLIDMIRSGEL